METPIFCLARDDEPEEKARMVRRFKYHQVLVSFFNSKDDLHLHLQTLTCQNILVCTTGHLLINQFKNYLKSLSQHTDVTKLGGTGNIYLNREKYLASESDQLPGRLFPLFLPENGNQRQNYLLTELSIFQIEQLIFDVYLSTTELLKGHLVVNQNFCLAYPEWLPSLRVKVQLDSTSNGNRPSSLIIPVFSINGGIGKTNYSVWFNLPPFKGKQEITISSIIAPQTLTTTLTLPKIEYLAVTTVLRDEEEYLDEWIRHYLSLGVSRFYLFDHMTKNKKRLHEICHAYSQVTLINFSLEKDILLIPYRDLHNYYPQSEQINLVISKYGGSHRWLILCDVDEFLFVDGQAKQLGLTNFLLSINDPFLSIETYSFGCRHISDLNEKNGLKLTQLFRKPKAEGPDWRTKCIIDPRKVSLMDIHLAVNFFGQRKHVPPAELNFRHYMYRPLDVINRRTCPHGELDSFCIEKEYAIIMYPGKEHFFREVAEMICYAMERRGQKCRITEKISPGYRYLAFGLNEGQIRDLPNDSIVVNMEQLYFGSKWVNENYRSLLSRYTLWDYNLRNLKFLMENWKLSASLFSFGYVPGLNHVSSKDNEEVTFQNYQGQEVNEIDVLVMGSLRAESRKRQEIVTLLKEKGVKAELVDQLWGKQRTRVLSRIKILLNIHLYDVNYLETTRICYALNNNLFIISEECSDINDYSEIRKYFISAPYEKITETVLYYLEHEKEREEFRQHAFTRFQQIKPTLPPLPTA